MIDLEGIERLDKWFADEERSFDTSHSNGQYNVSQLDVYDFCDYLTENEPDLIGIPCMVCAEGIWFKDEDLKNANHL